ncbi:MAG TPA: hypothetical protein VMZ69_02535, partial [Saprospiraceae bacterium]|nr:hypothetical protein [Saprospiraceae bacterium]
MKYFIVLLLATAIIPGCTKKAAPATTEETSIYGISYYRGVDFPAEYVFISILNPKHPKIRRINFLNEPQSLIADLPAYGPQIEKNLYSWGIGASKYLDKDSNYLKQELLRNITTNSVEIIYGDSTTQTSPIKEVPHWKYIEKYK